MFTPSHRGGSGEPMVLVHGFTDIWRTWELVLPALERRYDVFAPTLLGHAGGPALPASGLTDATLADDLERALDDAGLETAHVVGNSLGGYVALQLAERGRARSVVALAPAGGLMPDDMSFHETLAFFRTMQGLLQAAAPQADQIVSTDEGRRRATEFTTVNYEHLPPELIADQMRGAAACEAALPMIAFAAQQGWRIEPERITCPVRIVWGTEDRILPWPGAAERYRTEWLPDADWVELPGVGHCPQLDVPERTVGLIAEFIDAVAAAA
jgi:pimeloyl-ACP methyl ester carboxylesterase